MRIGRNSKEFKKLKNVIDDLSSDADLKKKITLYIVKAGDHLDKRIKLSSQLPDYSILFNLQWEAIKFSFLDKSFKLNRDDNNEGLYFFKSSTDPAWDQNPFELKGRYRKELEIDY